MALSGSCDDEMNHISYANASRHMFCVHRGFFFVSFIASIVSIQAVFSLRPPTTGAALRAVSQAGARSKRSGRFLNFNLKISHHEIHDRDPPGGHGHVSYLSGRGLIPVFPTVGQELLVYFRFVLHPKVFRCQENTIEAFNRSGPDRSS